MEEELPSTDIPTVSATDAVDYVEEEHTELTVLKPVSYDVCDLSANKPEIFDKMDIDNHNIDFDERPSKTIDVESASNSLDPPDGTSNSINESGDGLESVKLNGVLKRSIQDKNTPESSPNAIHGKSRYGRIRKPKLSTDFVSVDKKSFAVLNNTSSYEPSGADDTPGKSPEKRKKRPYRRRSTLPPKPEEPEVKPVIKEVEKVSYITQSLSVDDKVDDSVNTSSNSPTLKADKDDLFEASISPLNCKDTLKTYSRKGETFITSSTTVDDTPKVDEQVKTPQISHVELNWKVGDVAWAKIGCYPYWPSIVTLEYGSSIYVKSLGHRRLAVHVQFFGDRGRRSWVLTTSLMKYQSKEQFNELKQQHKKDKIKFKYFLIKPSCQDLWEKATSEADTVLKLPHDERITYYQSLYPVAEETYVAEMNMLKAKQTPVYKKKNPDERRGRKRKILDDSLNDSTNQEAKKPRQSDPGTEDAEKLPNSEETPVKKPRQLDEHTKKRRAFMRRMNKILKQSNDKDRPIKKGLQNGLKLQRMKNAKFNKLLNKENQKNKPDSSQPGTSTSPDSDQKKKDMSIYDFESEDETDVYISSYNYRLASLSKAEQDKADQANDEKSDKDEKSVNDEDKELTSNESKARRLFATDKKPKIQSTQPVLPKGTGSKFSKLFEHRKPVKSKKNARKLQSCKTKAKQTKSEMAKKLRERQPNRDSSAEPSVAKDDKKSETKPEKEVEVRKRLSEKVKKEDVRASYETFKEKLTDKVNADHPDFTENEVEKHLEKLWNELDDSEKSKYKPEELESISDDGDDEVKSSSNENDEDSKSDEKSSLPALRPRKISSIFAGYKLEKVCQICEKNGDTVRCRGPCAGYYHVECVQKMIAKGKDSSINKTPTKRGRRKKSSIKLELKAETTPAKKKLDDVDKEADVQEKADDAADDLKTENAKESEPEELTDKEFAKPVLRRSRRVLEENERLTSAKTAEDLESKTNEDQPELEADEKTQLPKTDEKMEVPDAEEKMEVDKPADDAGEEIEKLENDVETMKDIQIVDAIKNEADIKVDLAPKEDEVTIESALTTENEQEHQGDLIDHEGSIDAIKEPIEIKEDSNDKETDEGEKADNVDVLDKDDTAASDISENLSISTKTDTSNGVDFRCHLCCEGLTQPCFGCHKEVEEKTVETERFSCYIAYCGRVFHKECLKAWPQATWGVNSGKPRNSISNGAASKESLMCPQHYCHTCISDNPPVLKNKQNQGKLVRCIRCPTAYHQSVHCIPAGTELLTMTQIICPRHYEPPKMKSTHVNTSWCFICCIGGSLICCEECPTSFHAECLKLSPEEYEGRYICDDCQTGRYLLYGEVVWVKLGHYRWWPAHILYPHEIPDNIANMSHLRGEFVVKFFGSHDYNWVNRGRAFLYQEGDSGRKNYGRSTVDLTFEKALVEAEDAHQKLKVDKALRDEEAKVGLKPPRYGRIKSNKPVGNVRIVELNTSNIPDCKCDPNSERPCAPESDCLNRMLMVECNPRVCSAGERCLNQAFEKRVYPPLVPCKTDKRGWGLKTLVDIKKGDFIIEYVGEMIDEEEYKRRINHMYKNQQENYYFLTIDNNRMLDAGPKGNVSRFMNHSCDPNCETQKWTVNGDTRVGLFAVEDIPANKELVFNYNLATLGTEKKPCFCGSEKCSGYIGVKAVKNGNNGNGEEDGRKRSNEENRKRSLDDKSTPTQKGKKVAKKSKKMSKAKRKALPNENAKKKKIASKSKDELKDIPSEENDADKTLQESDAVQVTDVETDSKEKNSKDAKPKTTVTEKKEKKNPKNAPARKETEPSTSTNTNLPGTNPDGENCSENDETITNDEAETSNTSAIPEHKEKMKKKLLSQRHKALFEKNKLPRAKKPSPIQKNAGKGAKKKNTLRKRNEKLGPNRNIKILPKKRKLMKPVTVVKAKKLETSGLKKRGRKPHLTEEDKEEALYKSIKKRIQNKLRFMTGISKLDEVCFVCGKAGELIVCDNKKCPRGYHITCVKKIKFPKGRWLCPWHYCTECNSKCKVIKCSKCINSYCIAHLEGNVFVDPEENYFCVDHKSEYLADKLLSLSRAENELANMSTDNESLNATVSSIDPIEAESLLLPVKAMKVTPKRVKAPPRLRTILVPDVNVKIKQESLSDVEDEPEEPPSPVVIESRNVARRSTKPGSKSKSIENRNIDNMEIDDFIEVHHVEAIDVSAAEADAKTEDASDSGEEAKQNVYATNEVSDDEYVDLEMEVINDDSS